MPIYEYQCEDCGRQTEALQRLDEAPLQECPHCGGGPMRKLISAPAFQFKGSGWYVTDYAKKSGGDSSAGSGGDTAGKDSASGDAGAKSGGDSGGSKEGSSGSKSATKPAAGD